MKHLLKAASFAKKFVTPDIYDPQNYVDVVNTLVILSQARNS